MGKVVVGSAPLTVHTFLNTVTKSMSAVIFVGFRRSERQGWCGAQMSSAGGEHLEVLHPHILISRIALGCLKRMPQENLCVKTS